MNQIILENLRETPWSCLDSVKVRRINHEATNSWPNGNLKGSRLCPFFKGLDILMDAGIKPKEVMVYMVIGYWPGETKEKPEYLKTKFPIIEETENIFGEIIISLNQAKIQAEQNKQTTEHQLKILLIHGLLHLMGFDHEKHNEQEEMQGKEKRIINLVIPQRV